MSQLLAGELSMSWCDPTGRDLWKLTPSLPVLAPCVFSLADLVLYTSAVMNDREEYYYMLSLFSLPSDSSDLAVLPKNPPSLPREAMPAFGCLPDKRAQMSDRITRIM